MEFKPKSAVLGDILWVFDRYRFAVPVRGVVNGFSDHDNSLHIDFKTFERYNNGGKNTTKYSGYFHPEQCRRLDGSPLPPSYCVDAEEYYNMRTYKPTPSSEMESKMWVENNSVRGMLDENYKWAQKTANRIMTNLAENCHTTGRPLPSPGNASDILDGAEDPRLDPLTDNVSGYIPFAYHLVPIRGLAKVAAVMRCGERKGRPADQWQSISVKEHLNHAISHIMAFIAGKRDEHHLANAGCRVLMALDLDLTEPLPTPTFDPRPDGPSSIDSETGSV